MTSSQNAPSLMVNILHKSGLYSCGLCIPTLFVSITIIFGISLVLSIVHCIPMLDGFLSRTQKLFGFVMGHGVFEVVCRLRGPSESVVY